MKKSFFLTVVTGFLLVFFFMLPRNNEWFHRRILTYWKDFKTQKNNLDIEKRKIKRWERDYTVSKLIADSFAGNHTIQNVLVLIPSSAYFKERNFDYHVPEPAVFYYYTGLKTIWMNSSHVMKANWMVAVSNGALKMIPATDKNSWRDSLRVFKKYPVSL